MTTTKINTENLTDSQIMRKVIAATKKYIKDRGWDYVQFRYVRGIYHFTNLQSAWLDAKDVLELATGLDFIALHPSSAKRMK